MGQVEHDYHVKELVKRLARKDFSLLGTEVAFRHNDQLVYRADVLRLQEGHNGIQYLTAYEIKTGGLKSRRKALQQAGVFFNSVMHAFNVVPRFVYINTNTRATEVWKSALTAKQDKVDAFHNPSLEMYLAPCSREPCDAGTFELWLETRVND